MAKHVAHVKNKEEFTFVCHSKACPCVRTQ